MDETFKQIMAFPLYASVGYLIWVLAGQIDPGAFLGAIFGLVIVHSHAGYMAIHLTGFAPSAIADWADWRTRLPCRRVHHWLAEDGGGHGHHLGALELCARHSIAFRQPVNLR